MKLFKKRNNTKAKANYNAAANGSAEIQENEFGDPVVVRQPLLTSANTLV